MNYDRFSGVAREFRRPWKLATFALGLLLLVVGSYYYKAPDWDVPVCFLMAVPTYLTAGWSMRVIVERRWRHWPLMLFFAWLCVDGLYAAYWSVVDPDALAFMRSANAPASLCLYLACGLVWYWNGSAVEAWQRFRSFAARR
ncbi:MAG: hypothetical protein KAX66_00180 [Propionivibrio sp.]|nr:hypothetical protein [Propionivibrio sp.]